MTRVTLEVSTHNPVSASEEPGNTIVQGGETGSAG